MFGIFFRSGSFSQSVTIVALLVVNLYLFVKCVVATRTANSASRQRRILDQQCRTMATELNTIHNGSRAGVTGPRRREVQSQQHSLDEMPAYAHTAPPSDRPGAHTQSVSSGAMPGLIGGAPPPRPPGPGGNCGGGGGGDGVPDCARPGGVGGGAGGGAGGDQDDTDDVGLFGTLTPHAGILNEIAKHVKR